MKKKDKKKGRATLRDLVDMAEEAGVELRASAEPPLTPLGEKAREVATQIVGEQVDIDMELRLCQERRFVGYQRYGVGNWSKVDLCEGLVAELHDVINYSLMQILKLRVLQKACRELEAQVGGPEPAPQIEDRRL